MTLGTSLGAICLGKSVCGEQWGSVGLGSGVCTERSPLWMGDVTFQSDQMARFNGFWRVSCGN